MNEKMQQLIKKDEQIIFVGDEKYFTGKVNVRMIFPSTEHNAYSMGLVEFEQGARSAWHTHPAGQQLVVVKGTAYTKAEGQPVQVFREGEAVNCPPDVKHWHGAGKDAAMSHYAVTAEKNGSNVTWLEKVTDAEYESALQGAKDLGLAD